MVIIMNCNCSVYAVVIRYDFRFVTLVDSRVGYRNPVPIWHRYLCNRYVLQPQIRKSWDSMENANKKRK